MLAMRSVDFGTQGQNPATQGNGRLKSAPGPSPRVTIARDWAQLRLQRAHQELGLIGDRSLEVLTHVRVEMSDRVVLDLVSRSPRGQRGRALCGRDRVLVVMQNSAGHGSFAAFRPGRYIPIRSAIRAATRLSHCGSTDCSRIAVKPDTTSSLVMMARLPGGPMAGM